MNGNQQQQTVARAELETALSPTETRLTQAIRETEERTVEAMRDIQTELLRAFERFALH